MAVSSISGAIKWTGLASGSDFATVVNQLVAIEQRTITRQETWQTEWKKKLTAITGLDSRLGALKLDAQGYDSRDKLLSRSAASSNESVVTLRNTSTAATGVYEVEVGANIREKIASGTYKDADPIMSAPPLPGDNFTITMGGKTLALTYNAAAAPANNLGEYSDTFTMQQLADVINATVAAGGYAGPEVSAEVIYDKTRGADIYSRLVITGGQGGSVNHITIEDPTDLGLDQKNFDAPVTTSMVGSTAVPIVAAGSVYTGGSNKTITFVPTVTGVLGEKDLTFSWADTEGNKGSFILKASEWDSLAGAMQNDVEIIQGLKLNFAFGANGNFIANEAFTIDCQTPVLQQAADSGLAVADKWIHRGWSDQTSPVTFGGAGNFDFSYAGEVYSVPVADGLGLSGLAAAINNYAKNPGVIASVINDGQGTATSYKLVLTGAQTGVEHGIEILATTSLNRLDCVSPGSFEHVRRAANSMTRFDGYPNDGVTWLQRPSNEVGDVIDGTVVNLTGSGKATIQVQNNVTDMINKIKSLVESVNLTKTYIKEQTKWGSGKLVSKVLADGTLERKTEGGEESGIMIGNYGFQISLSEIDKLMTGAIFSRDEFIRALDPGGTNQAQLPLSERQALYQQYLDDNGLLYTRLSDIGIASNHEQSGVYVIEESKLRECLTRNPEAVLKLFTFRPDDAVFSSVTVHEDEAPRPRFSGFAVQMGFRMSDLTRSGDVIDPATGDVLKSAKGITKVLAENYTNIISGIDAKIAREQKRVDLYRQRMEEKFARLEKALAQLNSTSESLSSQLAQLSGNNSSS